MPEDITVGSTVSASTVKFSFSLFFICTKIKLMTKQKYLGFAIPEELQQTIEDLLTKLKASDDKSQYSMEIFKVVQELSHEGLDYFFIRPLKKAQIGRIKMKSIQVALNAGKRGIFAVARGILRSMNDEQLNVVVELFEQSLTVHPDDLEDEQA